ncbi:tRNA1(Val) (adenine(37)-N6)-methyltransferase [Bacteroides sp. 224]|uniref:tRNA1(Val) (adenine(37)-N6)-methyltransferase n=1 Tax=Bacteroides sp. 224 TaxID=2302936 RepID=UPI0013CF8E5F|nr:methyltransferase [Bacteroides sp. 224]NDV64367.1 methyltransferase domain-containing protein [Bacteroides sp. 224]
MSNSYFKFKQFCIHQDRCAMKVGTDGVLLGAWTKVDTAKNILDIGTGTGLVALMLAQRSSAHITALEIDPLAAKQAEENILESPWKDRMEVVCIDFNVYTSKEKFDIIVSNPPFFVDSLTSPVESRTAARHNYSLPYSDLLQGVSAILNDLGEFSIIIPYDVSDSVKSVAEDYNLFPCRQLNIITTPGKNPKRCLITFVLGMGGGQNEIRELLLEKERHCYSDEYAALTKDFYLKG